MAVERARCGSILLLLILLFSALSPLLESSYCVIEAPASGEAKIATGISVTYEGTLHKRFMNFLTLQPLVVDQALMPYMKAMYVPFHLLYGSLICYQRLQSDRPK